MTLLSNTKSTSEYDADLIYDHEAFRAWRLVALAFKAFKILRPDYDLWRDFPNEYEYECPAIDLINGSELLRQWVVDDQAATADLETPRNTGQGILE